MTKSVLLVKICYTLLCVMQNSRSYWTQLISKLLVAPTWCFSLALHFCIPSRGSKLWQLSVYSVVAFHKHIQVFTSGIMKGRAYIAEVLIQV